MRYNVEIISDGISDSIKMECVFFLKCSIAIFCSTAVVVFQEILFFSEYERMIYDVWNYTSNSRISDTISFFVTASFCS